MKLFKMKNVCAIALVSCFALASCKKDFLTLTPQSQATEATFYKTTKDITTAVSAAYASLQATNMYQEHFITMMEARSDNVEDINPGGNAGRDFNIDRFTAKSDNVAVKESWEGLYNAVSRCNNTLAHLEAVTDPALRTQYEGELKFLRALHYFNIVRLWGTAPLVLKPISTTDAQKLSRNSVQEIYAAIEADLTAAATALPANYAATVDIGRATQGAAKALLGKVYLTQNKYAQAVAVLKELIPPKANPYQYELLSNVAEVFNVNNKMNAEIIFVVRYSKTLIGEGHGLATYFNQPAIDPTLLAAYGATDARRDLLNVTTIDVNNKAVKKYFDSFDPNTKTLGNDYILLRYADVLLMYAEALNELAYEGDATKEAFVYLNAVRTRANATPYTEAELMDQAGFRKAVLLERRLELPLELHRWFDLVRSRTAIESLQNSGLTKLTINSDQYLYPIPQSEINSMNNLATFPQNPGY